MKEASPSLFYLVVVVIATHTTQSLVTGQAPITLERKITSGGKHNF